MGGVFSDRMVISVSCTSAGMRVSSSTRAMRPSDMAHGGLSTSAARDGPLRAVPIVPAIPHLFFAGARRTLDDARGVAADGRRQMLGHPRFRRSRNPVQQERPIRRQRSDRRFDDAAVPDILADTVKPLSSSPPSR